MKLEQKGKLRIHGYLTVTAGYIRCAENFINWGYCSRSASTRKSCARSQVLVIPKLRRQSENCNAMLEGEAGPIASRTTEERKGVCPPFHLDLEA